MRLKLFVVLFLFVSLTNRALSQPVMSTSEIVITPDNGFWQNSLNTSNPTSGAVFTAKDGSQWICFAQIRNRTPAASPDINIAHIVNGKVTLTSPVLPFWTTTDQHNGCSIALDKNGFVHLTYDMHVSPLNYYKSVNPNDGSSFIGPLPMLGTNENGLTFPVLFTNPVSGELYFTFQHGGGANGVQYFYHYNAGTSSWEGAAGTGVAGNLTAYAQPPAGATFLSGLPQWDRTTGNLWFSYQIGPQSAGPCGTDNTTPPNPCGEYLLGWNGTSFLKFGGAAQSMPVTYANSAPVYVVSPGADPAFMILDSVAIDSNGTFFLPYGTTDANGFIQFYVLESSTGAFVRHQILSNTSVFVPPVAAGWLGPGTAPSQFIQRLTAVSSGTCTWVSWADIFHWGAGQIAVKSCDNFATLQTWYLTTKFNPNGIIFPDQVRNYRDGSISFLFEQVNDVQFAFSTFINATSPDLGKISIITWSPGGCSFSGRSTLAGSDALE
jgi:BNR repeat-containing family member